MTSSKKEKDLTEAQTQRASKISAEARPLSGIFTEALQRLEETGDVYSLLEIFSDDAEISNLVMPAPQRGRDAVARFWRNYRSFFREIHSTFDRVSDTGEIAVIEWTSTGALPSGKSFSYPGVTILECRGGKVARMKTYYDSAVFLEGGAKHLSIAG